MDADELERILQAVGIVLPGYQVVGLTRAQGAKPVLKIYLEYGEPAKKEFEDGTGEPEQEAVKYD